MESNRDKKKVWGILLSVFLISFLSFAPDLRNEFVQTWDDDAYILINPYIRTFSLETIKWAFFDFYHNYWAPLTWISFMLDYSLWGLDPFGYHLTNNIIHSINAALFFLLSLALFKWHRGASSHGDTRPAEQIDDSLLYGALLSALFFSIHPLRVESVAWATERKDVLSLFFGIPAVLAYLKHVRAAGLASHSRRFYFIVSPYYYMTFALHCLSLMSKATLVTLPMLLLVLDWFPLKRLNKQNIKDILLEKVPFLLSAGVGYVMISAAHAGFTYSFSDVDMQSRILIAFKSIMDYLRLTFWPVNLSPFHLHPLNITHLSIEYIIPIIFFVITTFICALLVKRCPGLMAAWLIYLIALIPMLGLTQFSHTAMADRFTYIPGLSIALLAGSGFANLTAKLSDSRAALTAISIGTIFLFSTVCFLTVKQISIWKDDVTLWSRAIDLQPHFSGRMYFQRSLAFKMKGDFEKALLDINEALAIATMKKFRNLDTIYAERARILKQSGDINGAIRDYTTAISLADNSHQRGAYHFERGNIHKEMGLNDLADADFMLSTMSDAEK